MIKMGKIMKTMKKNPLLLFAMLVLLILLATILSTSFINNTNSNRAHDLKIKSLQIEENTKEISDKISNLEFDCPEQKECPECICPKCPEQKDCPECNCPKQNDCPDCNCNIEKDCPICNQQKTQTQTQKNTTNEFNRMDEKNSIFSDFSNKNNKSLEECDPKNKSSKLVEPFEFENYTASL
tara:strand:- start:493 stop:1038 length:546 start_codon:yes stop_codon:yes gene_type:complete